VLDVLACLKRLMQSPEGKNSKNKLSLKSMFLSMIAVFETLRAHRGSLEFDVSDYYRTLYSHIHQLGNPNEEHCVKLGLECLSLLLEKSASSSKNRVLAFVKKMFQVSLLVPPYAAIGLLHLICRLRTHLSSIEDMLDVEDVVAGSLSLQLAEEQDDPDVVDASNTTAWESVLLTKSYHPYLRHYAHDCVFKGKLPALLARVRPSELTSRYDSSGGGFNPPLRLSGDNKKELRRRDVLRKIKFQSLRVDDKKNATR